MKNNNDDLLWLTGALILGIFAGITFIMSIIKFLL